VTDLLVEHFPEVVDLEFTARMESQLDDVARGEHEWVPMVRDFWGPFSEKIAEGREKIAKQVETTDRPCPLTGERGDMLVKRFGRNGWFLGCSGYPDCKYTEPLPGEEPEPLPELPGVGETCPECGQGTLTARRGRFGPFVGCDRYPECRHIKKEAQPASEQFGTCPKCGIGTVVTKRGRRGRRPFWGCNRYPECDYATWTRPGAEGTDAAPPTDGDAPPSPTPARRAPRRRARGTGTAGGARA
jgi:DNA topoisomerase-1